MFWAMSNCLPGDQVVVTGQPSRAWPALGLGIVYVRHGLWTLLTVTRHVILRVVPAAPELAQHLWRWFSLKH